MAAAPHQAPGALATSPPLWVLRGGGGVDEGLRLAGGGQHVLLAPSTPPMPENGHPTWITSPVRTLRRGEPIQLAGFKAHHGQAGERGRKHEQSPTTTRSAQGQPS